MPLSTDSEKFLQELKNKDTITIGDLKRFVEIYETEHTTWTVFHPGRWASGGLPRSIFELKQQLGHSYYQYAGRSDADPLSDAMVLEIQEINSQRYHRLYQTSVRTTRNEVQVFFDALMPAINKMASVTNAKLRTQEEETRMQKLRQQEADRKIREEQDRKRRDEQEKQRAEAEAKQSVEIEKQIASLPEAERPVYKEAIALAKEVIRLNFSQQSSAFAERSPAVKEATARSLLNEPALTDTLFIAFARQKFNESEGRRRQESNRYPPDCKCMLEAMIYLIQNPDGYTNKMSSYTIKSNNCYLIIPSSNLVRPRGISNDAWAKLDTDFTRNYALSILSDFKLSILRAYLFGKCDETFDRMYWNRICIGEKMRDILPYTESFSKGTEGIDEKMFAINGTVGAQGGYMNGERAITYFLSQLGANQSYTTKDLKTKEKVTFVPDRNYVCWYLDNVFNYENIPDYTIPDICDPPVRKKMSA